MFGKMVVSTVTGTYLLSKWRVSHYMQLTNTINTPDFIFVFYTTM